MIELLKYENNEIYNSIITGYFFSTENNLFFFQVYEITQVFKIKWTFSSQKKKL
jgi:hypothetical protein